MTSPTSDAVVIGCGVMGLTTAVALVEAGLHITIYTEDLPEDTTSAAAGAMWGPYLVEPRERVFEWSRDTFAVLAQMATDPDTGVRMVAGIEASHQLCEEPEWSHLVPGFRRCELAELPPDFVDGFKFTAPLVDMPRYLRYLITRFEMHGGRVQRRTVHSLQELGGSGSVIVNCTGVGARTLVPDPAVRPVRGQLVVVDNPGIVEFFSEDSGPSPNLTYIYPHGDTVVLGGCAQEGDCRREPDPGVAHGILQRCARIDGRLARARIIDNRVGLRPTRFEVRVEEERRDGNRILHNYGHGGSGITMSWGCAREITKRVLSGG
jgi:D-amino-acid oxidase